MTDNIKYTLELLKKLFIVFGILLFLVKFGHAQPTSVEDELISFSWKSPMAIFEEPGQLSYSFKAFDESDYTDITERWGYFLRFHADGTFSTNYHAPCGLDCFTRITGTYEWRGENLLELRVMHISRSELCAKTSEQVDKSYGIFQVKLAEGKLSLIK